MQDHLAHCLASRQNLQRVSSAGERKGSVDMRRDLAFRSPLHELFEIGAVFPGIETRPIPPEHTADIAAFQQREVEWHLRNIAGGKADHQKTAFPGDRSQSAFGVCSTDRIKDDVDALAAGKPT